jgi:hypothetical protein
MTRLGFVADAAPHFRVFNPSLRGAQCLTRMAIMFAAGFRKSANFPTHCYIRHRKRGRQNGPERSIDCPPFALPIGFAQLALEDLDRA